MTSDRHARILQHVTVSDVLAVLGYAWELVADRTQQIRCPVHEDRTPSARYYHEQQKIHCFTCGRTWDVVGLVAAMRSCSHEAAMDFLDEEFPTSETAETLQQRLRAQLRDPGGPDYGLLFDDTERRLIARRHTFDLATYSRRCAALDLVRYRLAHEEMSGDDVPRLCKRILE